MSEYHFDGTNITFRFTILDASGLVRQSGITGTTVTAYDSAKNEDPVTETITEIATTGDYEASIPYADINRAAGDGLWTFIPGHTNPDLTFEPKSVHIQISRKIGTATSTPSTTVAIFTGLGDLTANHYKDAFVKVIKSSVGNVGEIRKITASADSGGNVQLTFNAMSVALAANDMVEIIDR